MAGTPEERRRARKRGTRERLFARIVLNARRRLIADCKREGIDHAAILAALHRDEPAPAAARSPMPDLDLMPKVDRLHR